MAAPSPDWSVTLGWRDILTIISLILAVDGYRRFRSEKRARQEERKALKRQVAADAFHSLAQQGFELEDSLIHEAWDRAREQADRLRLALSEANGSWSEFLVGQDADKTDAASSQLLALEAVLHSAPPPPGDQLVGMRQQCATAYTLLGEIAGKLKYVDAPAEARIGLRSILRIFSKQPGDKVDE